MAACTQRTVPLIRLFRNVQFQNERRLSVFPVRLQAAGSSDEPPRFTPPVKPVIVDKSRPEEAARRSASRPVQNGPAWVQIAPDSTCLIRCSWLSVAQVCHQPSLDRFISPEFIPPRQRTNPLKFYLERKDMMKRRKALNIPEFYVGSILSVTVSDPHATNNTNRFVGICIQRSGKGLGATFILRNIVDGQGVEICYELYNPRMKHIEVLKLEKRLDDNLMYLRDALPEYSTFAFDMKPVHLSPTEDVPVNELKVRMKPRPWSKRWERPKFDIQGIRFDLCLTQEQMDHAQKWAEPWRRYDMLKEYDTSALEEKIYQEVQAELRK